MRTPRPKTAARLALVLVAIATVAVWTSTAVDPLESPTSGPTGRAPETSSARDVAMADLSTSGAASRETAIALDGLPAIGFIEQHRARALAVARRFLDGYFEFEVRQNWRWGARQVAATATPGLVSTLLAGGAVLPSVMDEMPPRAEVYAIDIEFDKPPTTAQIRAEVKRGSDLSDIAVIATRKENRWVIAQITE